MEGPRRRLAAAGAFVPVALAIALYAPTLKFGFSGLDDRYLIVESPARLGDASIARRAFLEDVFHDRTAPFYYRPLYTLSYALDALWGGSQPFPFRLTNLLLHVIATVLAWRLMGACGAAGGPRLVATAAFAVHPALAHAVAWIPGRNDTLLAVFTFVSVGAFVDWLRAGRRVSAALHVVAWCLALLTKESAVVVPILCVAWAVLVAGRRRFERRDLGVVAAWIVAGAVWGTLRHLVLANPWAPSVGESVEAIAKALPWGAAALGYLVAPWGLSVYPRADVGHMAAGVAALTLLAVAAVLTLRRGRTRVAFGVSWFVVCLLPSLARPYASDPEELLLHRLYVPAFGMAFALAALASGAPDWKPRTRSALLGAAIVVALAAASVVLLPRYASAVTFWEDAVTRGAGSPFALRNLGREYAREGRWSDAAQVWARAFAADRGADGLADDLLLAYRRMGISEGTKAVLHDAIARDPQNGVALFWLGACLEFEGRSDEAVAAWEHALAVDPSNAEARAALERQKN